MVRPPQAPTQVLTDSVNPVRDLGCAILRVVPRSNRRVVETPESKRLDAVSREFTRAEERLRVLREDLKSATIAAVEAGLSVSEAARRAGYTREYVSKLVNEARSVAVTESLKFEDTASASTHQHRQVGDSVTFSDSATAIVTPAGTPSPFVQHLPPDSGHAEGPDPS
jgi:hypothetical protein